MIDKEKAILASIQAYDPETKLVEQNFFDVLLTIFSDDEIPEGGLNTENYRDSWMWVTNTRLLSIAINRALFGKWKATGVMEYPYSKINAVGFTLKTGGWLSTGEDRIWINFAGDDVMFSFNRPKHVRIKEFADLIRSKLLSPRSLDIQDSPTQAGADPLANLERLVQLKSQGLLTEEEFKAAKAKLLGL